MPSGARPTGLSIHGRLAGPPRVRPLEVAAVLGLLALVVVSALAVAPGTPLRAPAPGSTARLAVSSHPSPLVPGRGVDRPASVAGASARSGIERCPVSPLRVSCPDDPPVGPATGPANTSWSNLTTIPQPTPILGASMAYDAADGYVIAFGGFVVGTNQTTNQTWKFQGGFWSNITRTAGPAPSPRSGMSMVYDAADGYVLAFGGIFTPGWRPGVFYPSATPSQDTYKFQSGRWSQVDVTCADWMNGTIVPVNNTYVGYPYCPQMPAGTVPMAYDAADGYVVMTGQWTYYTLQTGTFTYLNGTWTRVVQWPNASQPTPTPNGGIATLTYDAADREIVAFGAGSWNGGANNLTFTYSNYSWTNLTSPTTPSPPSRLDASLAYDSRDGYTLVYGGYVPTCVVWNGSLCNVTGIRTLNDTWEFHNGTWANLTAVGSPGPREGAGLVDDLGDQTMLVEGGATCATNGCEYPALSWCPVTPTPPWPQSPYQTLCPNSARAVPSDWVYGGTPPIVDLALSVTHAVATANAGTNLTVVYRGGSPTVSFAWVFGDGTNASGQSVSHVYRSAGSYVVTVWVNDTAGHSQDASVTLVVNAALGVGPSATPRPTDVGLPVGFAPGVVNGTPPYTYRWTFGDGNSSDLATPSHAYATNGSFGVDLVVNDSAGALVNASLVVVVDPPLHVRLNVTPLPADLGQLVNFSANASGGTPPYLFRWAFGDGGTGGDLANISHIYTTNGPFAPTVTLTDAAGQIVTAVQSVMIALNVSILSSGSLGAAPLGLTFESHVTGGAPDYSYGWSFGDGTTSSLADPIHTYEAPGQFNASVEVTDADGSVARSETWTVIVAPGGGPLALEVGAGAPNVSLGGTEIVTADPHGGVGAYSLVWTAVPSGCAEASLLALRCPGTASGSYAVAATVTDAQGDVATGAATFTVGSTRSPNGLTGSGPNHGTGLTVALQEEVATVAIVGVVVATIAGFSLGRVSSRAGPRDQGSAAPYDRYRRPEPPRPTGSSSSPDPGATDSLNDLL